jgi:hypothetical protein
VSFTNPPQVRHLNTHTQKNTTMTLQQLLAIAREAYTTQSAGISIPPATYEEARQHTSGDLLADFVIITLTEALSHEPHKHLPNRAIDVLLHARDQIDAVISAIQQTDLLAVQRQSARSR